MNPRRPSNFPKEFPKVEDAKKGEQKRRGTLAQLLLGDKQAGKNNAEEGNSEAGRSTFHFVSPKDKRQSRSTSRRSGATENFELMKPKILHVMVFGPKDVGKTTFLRTLAFGHIPTSSTSNTSRFISPLLEQQNYSPTREDDTYHIQLHRFNPPNSSIDGNINKQTPTELILFHDTVGITPFGNIEFKRGYLQIADAFILVYSVTDLDSFNRVDAIKKQLEKEKFGGKEKRGGGGGEIIFYF